MLTLLQVAFIVLVPLVIIVGGLVTLFAIGAAFNAMEYPDELRKRVESIFRQPLAEPRTTGSDHYYRPHWKQG